MVVINARRYKALRYKHPLLYVDVYNLNEFTKKEYARLEAVLTPLINNLAN